MATYHYIFFPLYYFNWHINCTHCVLQYRMVLMKVIFLQMMILQMNTFIKKIFFKYLKGIQVVFFVVNCNVLLIIFIYNYRSLLLRIKIIVSTLVKADFHNESKEIDALIHITQLLFWPP